jgi:hypothetical protein
MFFVFGGRAGGIILFAARKFCEFLTDVSAVPDGKRILSVLMEVTLLWDIIVLFVLLSLLLLLFLLLLQEDGKSQLNPTLDSGRHVSDRNGVTVVNVVTHIHSRFFGLSDMWNPPV